MSPHPSGHPLLGAEICKVLGLDAQNVTGLSLTINAEGHFVPRLEVHMVIPPNKYNQVTEVIKAYHLVKDTPEAPETLGSKPKRRIKLVKAS